MDKPKQFTPISFDAILNKAQTVIDGGWRVTFDIPESDQPEVLRLCEHKEQNLKIVIVPEDYINDQNGQTD